jgi:hypothetical protein
MAIMDGGAAKDAKSRTAQLSTWTVAQPRPALQMPHRARTAHGAPASRDPGEDARLPKTARPLEMGVYGRWDFAGSR